MSQRKESFTFDEYYHIYNRGNSKQIIFKDDRDYLRFQSLLYMANGSEHFEFRKVQKNKVFIFDRGEPLIHIGSYCLMPNHFHILLTPAVEKGIQTFMKKLSTGYSMYFNKKYKRTGTLFEGRFKSQHVAEDRYLKYLFSYIHLNPVKLIQPDWKERGIVNLSSVKNYLSDYKYSSLNDYFGLREEGAIIKSSEFPKYFLTKSEIDSEMLEWLSYKTYAEDRPPQ